MGTSTTAALDAMPLAAITIGWPGLSPMSNTTADAISTMMSDQGAGGCSFAIPTRGRFSKKPWIN